MVEKLGHYGPAYLAGSLPFCDACENGCMPRKEGETISRLNFQGEVDF